MRHLGTKTFLLGGDPEESAAVQRRALDELLRTFAFCHGSLQRIKSVVADDPDITNTLAEMLQHVLNPLLEASFGGVAPANGLDAARVAAATAAAASKDQRPNRTRSGGSFSTAGLRYDNPIGNNNNNYNNAGSKSNFTSDILATLPYHRVDDDAGDKRLVLRAAQILKACRRHPHVGGGCILYDDKIVLADLGDGGGGGGRSGGAGSSRRLDDGQSLLKSLVKLSTIMSKRPDNDVDVVEVEVMEVEFNLPSGVSIVNCFVEKSGRRWRGGRGIWGTS